MRTPWVSREQYERDIMELRKEVDKLRQAVYVEPAYRFHRHFNPDIPVNTVVQRILEYFKLYVECVKATPSKVVVGAKDE
jgi:hypothetical protein